ncbi:type I secretion system permease/ATPase [Curvibacter sp. APW13]|uniref:type I secretion system permease/ATPase n=1 Tax=Curvibacter sp. APW13 TaxID=3077236 RepID=UPI0028DEB4F0|nr:type I secretion system permease/ATPase [Curvibacter sp. APW13]MDT8992894.1 type I secretion system permease/ATPase [Curvibacter sp. APW13]
MAFLSTAPPNEIRLAFRQLRSSFVSVVVFSAFLNVMLLAPSFYMMQVYDRVLASRNETTLLVLTAMILGAYLFTGALEVIRTWVLVRVGARLDTLLSGRILQASFDRTLRQAGGNAGQALYDLTSLRQTLTGAGLLALVDVPWLPFYMVVIYLASPTVAGFTAFGALLLVGITVLNERSSKLRLEAAQTLSMKTQRELGNHFQNAEVIEAMGMLGRLAERWARARNQELALQSMASDRGAVWGAAGRFVRVAMQSLSLGLGAMLVIEGQMSAGMMMAMSIVVSRALAPAESVVANWKSLITARSAYRRLVELLGSFPPRPEPMRLPSPQGQITFEGVSTAAPGSRQAILRQVSFVIQPGDVVAVIGASGAGKSTLARLLVGVWPAMGGAVRLDGADLAQWHREDLGPFVGYLPQDIELFDGTVAENIARFGDVDADEVVAAAQRVGVHEQILRLPQGYDTPLGPGGSFLSGGQRQRIGLARALYRDPVLVVLDEPNSNLDDVGEKALSAAVSDLAARGRTCVLITHRPAVLPLANKLMVLRDGTLAAYGPRDAVLAALNGRSAEPVPPANAGAGGSRPAPPVVSEKAASAPDARQDGPRVPSPPARSEMPPPAVQAAPAAAPFNLQFPE